LVISHSNTVSARDSPFRSLFDGSTWNGMLRVIYFVSNTERVDPRNPDPPTNLGGVVEEVGRLDEAVVAYERALAVALTLLPR
jgi:hypothetical protein